MSLLFEDGRSIEEALGLDRFDPAQHPRGRGGKFAAILGRIASLHRDLGGHPGVQNRLDRGQLHDGDVARIKSLARKKGSRELGLLVDEAQSHASYERAVAKIPPASRAAIDALNRHDSDKFHAGFDLPRRAPGGERHASLLFAPNTGGGGGLAPGHGATRLQSDELRADRYGRSKKAGMFAPHRGGGGSGLVPGAGVTRMQPDERRAATRMTPGGERSFSPGDRVQHRDGSQGKVTGEPTNGRVPVKFDDGSRDPNHVFTMKHEDLESLERPGGERRPLGQKGSRYEFSRSSADADVQDEYVKANEEVMAARRSGDQERIARAEARWERAKNALRGLSKSGSKMSRRQGHDLLTEAVVEMVRESLGGEIQHVFDEAKHPRGRGGKWRASFHGPVHGVQIPDVQVQGSAPSHLADQIRQHVEAHTGKKVEGVDVGFVDLRKGSGGDASGSVATRKAMRERKLTHVSLKRTGDGPASPLPPKADENIDAGHDTRRVSRAAMAVDRHHLERGAKGKVARAYLRAKKGKPREIPHVEGN